MKSFRKEIEVPEGCNVTRGISPDIIIRDKSGKLISDWEAQAGFDLTVEYEYYEN